MSLEVFYASVDGDYDGVKSRRLTEERISKFVNLFFSDSTYQNLVANLDSGNLKEAFRAAHTLKGVARDLGLTRIADPASELADALRPDENDNPAHPEKANEIMAEVSVAYKQAVEARSLLD